MPSTQYHWSKPFETISATTLPSLQKKKRVGECHFSFHLCKEQKSKDILKGAALKHLATRKRHVGEKKAALYTLSKSKQSSMYCIQSPVSTFLVFYFVALSFLSITLYSTLLPVSASLSLCWPSPVQATRAVSLFPPPYLI